MLLRRFAPSASPEQVWQIPARDDKPPFLTSITNASVVGYVYTMYRDRPRKDDDPWWETQVAEWEGHAAEVLDELLVHKRMRPSSAPLVRWAALAQEEPAGPVAVVAAADDASALVPDLVPQRRLPRQAPEDLQLH
jgi:hypothetical protein